MKERSLPTVFLAVVLFATSARAADDGVIDTGAIYDKARAAAVELLVGGRLDGSGWFADAEGHIVTAAHAVWQRNDPIEVMSPTLGRMPVTVVAYDRGHDIALLKAPRRDEPYPYLTVAEKMPAPGQPVFLYGSALFRHEVMIRGAVARKHPTFEYLSDQQAFVRVYHVSAPSPKGTSGGCWLDRHGNVCGNQSGFMSRDGHGTGIAMTAAPDAIARLVTQRTSAANPTLGTAFEESVTQPVGFLKRFPAGTTGVVPVLTVKDGPADKADLEGDMIITHIDDQPITHRDGLLTYMRSKRPGDQVTLSVLPPDGGERRDINLTLTALEQ